MRAVGYIGCGFEQRARVRTRKCSQAAHKELGAAGAGETGARAAGARRLSATRLPAPSSHGVRHGHAGGGG
jgi:hypothetical protein